MRVVSGLETGGLEVGECGDDGGRPTRGLTGEVNESAAVLPLGSGVIGGLEDDVDVVVGDALVDDEGHVVGVHGGFLGVPSSINHGVSAQHPV